jgi:hypothetical protein
MQGNERPASRAGSVYIRRILGHENHDASAAGAKS